MAEAVVKAAKFLLFDSSSSSVADILTDALEKLGTKRKIAVGVINHTETEWKPIGTYFKSGTSDGVLPERVPPKKGFVYSARKTVGPFATGVVGVFTINVRPSNPITVAVLFSVPFNYNIYQNWWDVQAFEGELRPDSKLYRNMYKGKPSKGDNGWHEKDIGFGLKARGAMSSSGSPTLQIHIRSA